MRTSFPSPIERRSSSLGTNTSRRGTRCSSIPLLPNSVPSLGELLQQGKANLDAWWIIVPTFALLVTTMLLLSFIGDALRDAFDTRKS